MQKITIIGAGLSGLYAAYLLQEKYDITILEARSRTGGRIHTIDGFDMGPSWVWQHQKTILALIRSLDLELFEQYTQGEALYHTHQGVQRFNPPPSPTSLRLKGGLETLVNALVDKLKPNTIHLNQHVTHVQDQETHIKIMTQKEYFESDYVISTLPPRLVEKTIDFLPELPAVTRKKLQNIPTWMGHTLKCVIEFEHNFWVEDNLSGFVFSHQGPLSEIHDASTSDKAALFGFSSTTLSKVAMIEAVKEQLITLFGTKATSPKTIHVIDWRKEEFSSVEADSKGLHKHPNYGFELNHFNQKVYFIGTESAYNEGGYLEGALHSAITIANHISSKQ